MTLKIFETAKSVAEKSYIEKIYRIPEKYQKSLFYIWKGMKDFFTVEYQMEETIRKLKFKINKFR